MRLIRATEEAKDGDLCKRAYSVLERIVDIASLVEHRRNLLMASITFFSNAQTVSHTTLSRDIVLMTSPLRVFCNTASLIYLFMH